MFFIALPTIALHAAERLKVFRRFIGHSYHRFPRERVSTKCLDSRSLAPEVAPFGIHTMLVEPGFFRTQLLSPESTKYARPLIADYAERTEETVAAWKSMNGKQGGDPEKLANALVQLASETNPPFRFVAGADAVATIEKKGNDLLAQARAHYELSSNLAIGEQDHGKANG
ncbi:MAG TPA: hypothetical protein VME66_13725 [Candidatus Acidoferrales bacterium]|nr:hypothetical protein [Candidatus Acidoferrales bacterium]